MTLVTLIKLFITMLNHNPNHVAKIGDHFLIIIAGLYFLIISISNSNETNIHLNFLITFGIIFIAWLICSVIVTIPKWIPKYNVD